MKKAFGFFWSLALGPRALLSLFALGFPLVLVGHYSHAFEAFSWLSFSPQPVWNGQVWRLVTYAFVTTGILDWLVSLFWLTTLVCVLARNWNGRELWIFCLLCTISASSFLAVLHQPAGNLVGGNGAMILGLLGAWDRLYRRERIILLGIGEMSVRQAASVVAVIEILLLFFGSGWLVTLAMIFGGAIGWLYLFVAGKHALNRRSQVFDSARITRLEM